jgi:glycosyltransferase involved in cell wall biosynthesis
MKPEPLVSILIVNYNYGRFIGKAIESALSQTYSNIEVIVVDDGSTDNSREVIAGYNGRVRAVFKKNGGQPAATNAAFAASTGNIICLLDSDDYFRPDKVRKIVECYRQHEEASYVFHALQRVDMKDADIGIKEPMDGSRWLDFKVRKFMAPPSTGLTFLRSTWDRLKPMPEELTVLGDNYFKFVVMAIARGYYLAEPLAVMRIHGNNALSMDNWGAKRFPEELTVALAMRSNFPELMPKADRLVSITLAKFWQLNRRDDPTSQHLQLYFRSSSVGSKARIYGLAALRRCQQFSKAVLARRRSNLRMRSVQETPTSHTAYRS